MFQQIKSTRVCVEFEVSLDGVYGWANQIMFVNVFRGIIHVIIDNNQYILEF